jgi:hypothetical protein
VDTPIKPIETVYDGHRFRSRLEARWAVFFNALNIPYEYERQGFDLGNGVYYLPDFWLPSENCWIEVKPAGVPAREREKVGLFAQRFHDEWAAAYDTFRARTEPPSPLAATLKAAADELGGWVETVMETVRSMRTGPPLHAEQAPVLHRLCLDVWDRAQNLYNIGDRVDGHPAEPPGVYLCEGQPYVRGSVPEYTMRRIEGVDPTLGAPEWWTTYGDANEVALRGGGGLCRFDHPRLRAAYVAARGARFEHGEHGGRQ